MRPENFWPFLSESGVERKKMKQKERDNTRKLGIFLFSVVVCGLFVGSSALAEATDSSPQEQSVPSSNVQMSLQADSSTSTGESNASTSTGSETKPASSDTEPALSPKAEVLDVTTAEELVQNGGFDAVVTKSNGKWGGSAAQNWEDPWIPTGTDSKNGTINVVDGRLHIQANATYRAAVAQAVSIDASKTYLLSYDVSTAISKGQGVRVRVRSLGADGKDLTPQEAIYSEPTWGTVDSKHIEQIIQVSAAAQKVKVELFFENSIGEAWIDNVSLKEYQEPSLSQKQSEVETGVVSIGSNKAYVPLRQDLRYEVADAQIARVEKDAIYPVSAGQTAVTVYDGNQQLSTFTLEVTPHTETVFDTLRKNWEEISLSNKSYSATDEQMKNLLGKLETGVADSFSKWKEPTSYSWTLFTDLNFTQSDQITTAYRRLEQMAQVYDNPSSAYYHDPILLDHVKKGMAWLHEKVYHEQRNINGNWWDYEIGAPRALVNTLVYLYPYFTPEEIKTYTDPVRKFVADPTKIRSTLPEVSPAVGGNQTDLSKVTILEGALREDCARVQEGVNGLVTIMNYVDKGEGFYQDGSFIDHVKVAYTGAYGNVLIEGFSQLLPVIQSTEFALPAEKVAILDEWIEKAFMPILVRGELLDMTRGRSVSRASGESHVQAVEILRSLARIAESATPEQKQKLQSFVKAHLKADTYYSAYQNLKSYKDMTLFRKLLADDTIKEAQFADSLTIFNQMDKLVYRNAQSDYTFALSMYSNRTLNYEDMNNENRHGWYTADGMSYLYNNDLGHYSQNYWPTVDPYRLPGTTETKDKREDGSGEVVLKSGFVGATQLGNRYAAAVMDFNNWNDTLKAQKAWFILGDKIVFMGTDVNHQSDAGAITTIENRKLAPGKPYTYFINGQETKLNQTVKTEQTKSFYLTNGDVKQSIGYVFLTDLQTEAVEETRTGKWSDINSSQPKTEVKNSFVTLWHDQSKTSSHYAYVMVPNHTQEEVTKLASTISIVKQEKDLQVVYDAAEKVWGVVKYQDGEYSLTDQLRLTKAGLYTIQATDAGYRVAYYNPATKSSEQPIVGKSEAVKVTLETAGTAAKPSSVWLVQK